MENERVQLKMTIEVVMSVSAETLDSKEDFDVLEAIKDGTMSIDNVHMVETIIVDVDGEEHDLDINDEEVKESMTEFLKGIITE